MSCPVHDRLSSKASDLSPHHYEGNFSSPLKGFCQVEKKSKKSEKNSEVGVGSNPISKFFLKFFYFLFFNFRLYYMYAEKLDRGVGD